ncbi:hypothetical protein [Rathayibacter sp. Leaf248]|uniref:hypothetical protein n=1 Tax=Rathayibacter sp. Leaf248 TaxID=2876555 RepID=UPI001E62AE0C|nr:hypothetical protein [Rathayibacter sp. Leaf248]
MINLSTSLPSSPLLSGISSPTPSPLLVEMVRGAADPAWVQPAISAALLLVGAAIGSVSTYVLERRREAREDALRGIAERREDYHRFDDPLRIHVGELTLIGEKIIANAIQRKAWEDSVVFAETVDELEQATVEDIPRMWALNIAVSLISSDEVAEAALSYVSAVQNAAAIEPGDTVSFPQARKAGDVLAQTVRDRLTGPVPPKSDLA